MKKIIAVLLSVLVLFSAFGVCAFAGDDEAEEPVYYTITFVDYDGSHLASRQVISGKTVNAPYNPERESTDDTDYIFRGWTADGGNTIYQAATLPIATDDVTYTAVYAEETHKDNLTFWQLVASIFERINMIFEYFFKIFERPAPAA